MKKAEMSEPVVAVTPELLKQIQQTGQELLDAFVGICEENHLRYWLYYGTLLGAVRHRGPIPWDDDMDVAMPREDYERLKTLMLARPQDELYHIHCYDNDPAMYNPFGRLRKQGTVFRTQTDRQLGMRDVGMWLDICPFDEIPYNGGLRYRLYIMYTKFVIRLTANKSVIRMDGQRLRAKVMHLILKPFSHQNMHAHVERLIRRWEGKDCKYYIYWNTPYSVERETAPKDWFVPTEKLEYNGKNYCVPKQWDKVLRRIYDDYMLPPPPDKRVPHEIAVEIRL